MKKEKEGYGTTLYGRIISLSSWSTMWQCELHQDERQSVNQVNERLSTMSNAAELKFASHPSSHYFITDFGQVLMATSPEPPMGGHMHL